MACDKEPTAVVLYNVQHFEGVLSYLDDARANVPGFKATVMICPTTPDNVVEEFLSRDFLEVGVDGYHGATFEAAVWSEEEARMKLTEIASQWSGAPVFRAPNWATNELVEKVLEEMEWHSICNGATLNSWGNTKPKRYVYNCSPVASIVSNAQNPQWTTMVSNDAEYKLVTEVSSVQEYDEDQEVHNSWSHESEFGKDACKRMKEFIEQVKPTGKVADFGGNDGTVASVAAALGVDITVIDNSISRVAYAREVNKVTAIREDLMSLSLADDIYQWGFCSHTLEHMTDLDAAWNHIRRVCTDGCLVVVPIQSKRLFEGDPSHHQHKSAEEWAEYLHGEIINDPEKEHEAIVLCQWRET